MSVLKPLRSRGDTLVEVLIAIAVVTVILGAAFASANRSLGATQLSNERNEALKLTEAQAELLKSVREANQALVDSQGSSEFCIQTSGVIETVLGNCAQGVGGRYRMRVQRTNSATEPTTYTISATWDRFGGGEEQRLRLYYRPR